MLCLSQTTGYAIKALGCLTAPGAPWQYIADVARCTGVPRPYLAKIINSLARQGLVTARRGYSGGIALARPAAEISLLAVVEAVEGKDWLGPCLLAIEECAQGHDCPTHGFWLEVREQIREKLRVTSLAEVVSARSAAVVHDEHVTGLRVCVKPASGRSKPPGPPRPTLRRTATANRRNRHE